MYQDLNCPTSFLIAYRETCQNFDSRCLVCSMCLFTHQISEISREKMSTILTRVSEELWIQLIVYSCHKYVQSAEFVQQEMVVVVRNQPHSGHASWQHPGQSWMIFKTEFHVQWIGHSYGSWYDRHIVSMGGWHIVSTRGWHSKYKKILVRKNQNNSCHMNNVGVLIIIRIIYSEISNDPVHCIFAIPPQTMRQEGHLLHLAPASLFQM